jgi:hypothetical protein
MLPPFARGIELLRTPCGVARGGELKAMGAHGCLDLILRERPEESGLAGQHNHQKLLLLSCLSMEEVMICLFGSCV